MPLSAGTKLGVYEILRPLGAGGMGEVYRARDSKLKREVAIKILPDRLARDAEFVSRFGREARVLASLNHPNIASVYGLEESSGQQFLIMELVEGKTLAQRLEDSGRLPVEEVLTLSVQVAEALEAAHVKGITHRDMKPANVKVTPEGRVKILDFGLAKTFASKWTDPSLAELTTVGAVTAEQGRILGTLGYMSPEQLRGKPVDNRTDIWSFGCLLFELLTGKNPFRGETSSDTIATVLQREPDWESLPSDTPPRIKDLLRRCLQKDVAQRLPRMRDALPEIQEAQAGHRSWRLSRRQSVVAGAALLAGLLGVFLWPNLDRYWRARSLPKQKLVVVLPFRSIGGDASQQAFCDGLTETVTTALSKHGELSVVPATDSRRLESAQQARKEFGVNLVVSGTLQRRGDQVRLTLRLADAERGREIDAEPIDWPVDKLWAIEDAVLVKLADLLNLVLTAEPKDRAAVNASHIVGVYDAYLRGRGFLYRFDRPGNLDRALMEFEAAAQRDPGFALAYVGIAETHWRVFRVRKERNVLESARLAAERAEQINPQLATAHLVLGGIHNDLGQYPEAIAQLESAIQLDPRDAAPYRELGVLYYRLGKYPEADKIYAKAIERRPGDWLGYRSAASYYARTQRLGEAEQLFRKVIEVAPDNHEGYRNLGAVLLRLSRWKEAEDALRHAQSLNPTATGLTNLGFLYMQQHRYKEAVEVMEQAAVLGAEEAPGEFRTWGNLGDAYWLAQASPEKAKQAWNRAADIARSQLVGTTADGEVLAYLAKFEAKAGNPGPALEHIQAALGYSSQNGTVRFQAAIVYTLLGQNERALTELGAAVKRNYSMEEIQQAPELATLRGDPGYSQLFAQPPTKP